jgi:hypothetical protein
LRALDGKNDIVAELDRRAKERVQIMKQIYPAFLNGGAYMGYSQNDRPRREQWVYVGQSKTLVNDQPGN